MPGDAAMHEAMLEAHGGVPKRRRTDAAEHPGHQPADVATGQFPQDELAALRAAAAVVVGAGHRLHAQDDLLQLPQGVPAQHPGGREAPLAEHLGTRLQAAERHALTDLDEVQIGIAALDARLVSQLMLEVLTPWQAAAFLTQAFPYLADRHGLADLVRADLKFKRSLGQ